MLLLMINTFSSQQQALKCSRGNTSFSATNKMIKLIYSYLRRIQIEIDSALDYMYRKFTGIPIIRYSKITPDLFLGGQYGMKAAHVFEVNGITAIVNMRLHTIHTGTNVFPHVKVCNIPTVDWTPPLMEDLKKGVAFIAEEIKNGGKVYIHCKYGKGRGPSMIIAYLISTGMVFKDALDLVQKVRPFAQPNKVQVDRLLEYEKVFEKEKELRTVNT